MNALLDLPPVVRMAGVFVLGLIAGGAVNWAIYSLAWFARPISPWGRPHAKAPPRQWSDRLPVVGWMGLAREGDIARPAVLAPAAALGTVAWPRDWRRSTGGKSSSLG